MRHEVAEDGQLQLVLGDRDVGRVEELVRLVPGAGIEPRVDPVRLIDVAGQVAELDVYPPGGAPVDGGYMDLVSR
jgi:hypothetical protein